MRYILLTVALVLVRATYLVTDRPYASQRVDDVAAWLNARIVPVQLRLYRARYACR